MLGEFIWVGTSGVFVIGMILILVYQLNTDNKKKETLKNAHDKIVELRQKGIRADICPKCKGKGIFGAWDRECESCGGVGYVYDLPPLPDERDDSE